LAAKKIGSFFRLFSVIVLLCLAVLNSFGQVDTLVVYDTVYNAKEPLVITHQVYQKGLRGVRSKNNWYINAQYLAGHSFYSGEIEIKDGTWNAFGLEIGRKVWKNFELSIGFGRQTVYDNLSVKDIAYSYLYHQIVIYDTIGRYIDVINGVPVTKYAINKQIQNSVEKLPASYEKESSQRLLYYEIPLKMAYAITKGKYIFRPYIMLTYCFLATKNEVNKQVSYQSNVNKYGLGIELNYLIYSRLAANAVVQYSTNFLSVLKDSKLMRQQWALGFGLKYFL
jgi:hypothetical protein